MDVLRWRSDLVAGGVSAHRANRAVSILSAAMGAAVDAELIAANPVPRPAPSPGEARREPATLAEVEGIRARLRDPRGRAIVALMAYAGLRPSEVSTLAWSDVREATLVVRSASGGGGRENGAKTGSVRIVPLIRALREDLEAVERRGPLVGGPVNMASWRPRVWRPAAAELARRGASQRRGW